MIQRAANRRKTSFVVVGMSILVALAIAGPASAQNAPGNNGTLKIHAGAGEPAALHGTQPQVCTFHIHAFNFDRFQELRYTITSIDNGVVVRSGSFQVDGNGEAREPGEEAFSVPHAGSYRLDVATEDGGKSKVFQVTCEGGILGTTGGEPSPFVAVAGVLMTLGAALILSSRRRVWSSVRC